MIGKLQLWKESLESCKDSEEEMVERILRLVFFHCLMFQVTVVALPVLKKCSRFI